ncbi:MAG: hypothetical protein SV775_11165, partial [Thermodesulfobacteriota bacterium]|nr:hypothetical protein [Thermodesulfobacteriota bacterium]
MIGHKRRLFFGLGLFIAFLVVLVIMFLPVFKGNNALEFLDALYNSISKGSAYYIPKVKDESEGFLGTYVSIEISMKDHRQAQRAAALFEAGGAEAASAEAGLKVTGDLGKILENCLSDADAMYHNDGKGISGKYSYDERLVLFDWWTALARMESGLKNQKKFKEAKIVDLVKKKAVETSYNYYKIEPQKITDRTGLVVISLIFYVVYTLWYGFAVLF